MSLKPGNIRTDYFFISPVFKTLMKKTGREEGIIFQNTLKKEGKKNSLKKERVEEMPRDFLTFLRNEKVSWISLSIDFAWIALRTFELAGKEVQQSSSCLSIASSPFFIYYSLKGAQEYFQLTVSAVKTSRLADAFFWLGRGIDSGVVALGSSVPPIVEGLRVSGLITRYADLNLAFTSVIPFALIILGSVRSLSKGWAMHRMFKTLQKFNRQTEKDRTLATLDTIFKKFVTDNKRFRESHFTDNRRRELIQARINEILLKVGHLVEERPSTLAIIDKTLDTYDQLLNKLSPEDDLYEGTKKNHTELVALKEEVLHNSEEIIGMVRSEIHRKLCYHALFILMATMTLVAGGLFLGTQYYQISFGLALVSTSLNVIYILFNQLISLDRARAIF